MKVPTTEWVVLTDENPRRGGGALRTLTEEEAQVCVVDLFRGRGSALVLSNPSIDFCGGRQIDADPRRGGCGDKQ